MKRILSLLVALSVSSVSAATFTVTNTSDSGSGSLRDAINKANAESSENPHRIEFALAGTGVRTIALATPLPALDRPAVIDGYTQPGAAPSNSASSSNAVLLVELSGASAAVPIGVGIDIDGELSTVAGLVINGFGIGVRARGSENTVRGNFIGTNASGTEARPNATGVLIDGGNRNIIGGITTAARNVISGNDGAGVRITGDSSDNRIQGNLIGTQADGTQGLANLNGIEAIGRNNIGPGLDQETGGNVIASNTQNGISVTGNSASVFISRNTIYGNGLLGIDLANDGITFNDDDDADGGPNARQNYPVLETATRSGGDITLTGRFTGGPNARFYVEFFGNTADAADAREGDVFLGSTTLSTGAGGVVRFDLEVPNRSAVRYVTATATNISGGTSEFAEPVQLFPAGKVQNLSTRLRVETGEQVLIGGFIVDGVDPKRVIIRAIGPSLRSSELQDVLEDPTLELYSGTTLLAENDNWREGNQAEIAASGLPPSNDAESAIVRTLTPGAYTAIVRGKNNTRGIGLVEAFDLNPEANSRLANISTRGYVSTGNNVMIAGFILSSGNSKVVVRALGPSLEARGVSDVLQDPDLTIFDVNGNQIDQNNSWKQEQQKDIEELQLGPGNENEAAIVTTLPGGQYTAIVRGRENTRGVGLVEVYNIR
ncbi:MAG: hypothetical protein AVDCRST_MAG42-3099 [uncultured Chthoniobacterales bacterium]|uniref:Periplasmic copper-binding protein NosD beta helix domain-containing protein n=1 Tax=uncultured Chthoniobacterales bacterium TaxID=1836801 RepID=A0A6J4J6B4_9BACT|nr:MAG: hypothetical protein AVDCRST_MAG42-3099 [uncultured Chthoniobacterales bacterium]